MSSGSSLKKVTIWSFTLEVMKKCKIMRCLMIGFCHQQKIWEEYIKESKLSLLFSIVSSVHSTKLITCVLYK